MRSRILTARSRLTDDARRDAATAVAMEAASRWPAAAAVAAYLSVGTEPPTDLLIEHFIGAGTTVIAPIVVGDHLDWARLDPGRGLASGPLGVAEPTGDRLGNAALQAVDLVLVPALAVDRQGHRLGRGRGYYDRALVGVTAPVIAVVYDHEYVERLPAEPHDRPVDGVLRPSGFVSVRTI
jgi:5-formyltetrahydrofolate cyclo-ligase